MLSVRTKWNGMKNASEWNLYRRPKWGNILSFCLPLLVVVIFRSISAWKIAFEFRATRRARATTCWTNCGIAILIGNISIHLSDGEGRTANNNTTVPVIYLRIVSGSLERVSLRSKEVNLCKSLHDGMDEIKKRRSTKRSWRISVCS